MPRAGMVMRRSEASSKFRARARYMPQAFPFHPLVLALPVAPEVRLTDKGLVDVASQQFLPIFP